MQFIISQICGAISLIILCASYFCNKEKFLLLQTIANIFYGLSFVVSLSLVAGVNTFISTIRTLIFYLYEKDEKYIPASWVTLFAVLYVSNGILLYNNPWDFLTTISPIMFTAAMLIKKMLYVNYFMIIPNIMLFTYCLCNKFYTSAILDAIETGVIVTSIITYYIKRSKRNKKIVKKYLPKLKHKKVA